MKQHFAGPRSKKQIEVIAYDWRYAFDCVHTWAPDLLRIMEHKLPLIDPAFNLRTENDSDMETEAFTEMFPPEITVRSSVYDAAYNLNGRARFTLAHELGHYFLHGDDHQHHRAVNFQKAGSKMFDPEWQANQFAVHFLMPEDIVREFSDPNELAASCKVSRQAATLRMKELGMLRQRRESPPEVIDFLKKMNKLRGGR